jgi:phage tail sheath protein FI
MKTTKFDGHSSFPILEFNPGTRMPFVQPALSAPGVYVQEVPADKHHVTGVTTALTAFLGRTTNGPTNTPTVVRSFGEFSAQFGGLRADSPLTYAVQDFFENGGSLALIVRLFEGSAEAGTASIQQAPHAPPAGPLSTEAESAKAALAKAESGLSDAQAALAKAKAAESDAQGAAKKAATQKTIAAEKAVAAAQNNVGEQQVILASATGGVTLNLVAANAGGWGGRISYSTNTVGINATVRDRFSTETWDAADLFNLSVVRDLGNGRTQKEGYSNVSVNANAGTRSLGHMLATKSGMARLAAKASNRSGADSGKLSVATYESGLELLERVDLFNILCIPPDTRDGDTSSSVYSAALALCAKRRATLVVDPPMAWEDNVSGLTADHFASDLGISPASETARHAAVYFPRIVRPDPLHGGYPMTAPACGAIAGIYSRTDSSNGVWTAPAGLNSGLNGATGLSYKLTDAENGLLNSQGINAIRSFTGTGPVLWGARTMRGSDQLSDDYQYVNIRRLADYMEETLLRNTKWAVFKSNNQNLWSSLSGTVESFMRSLAAQGAFAGGSYFVKCDASTTTQDHIDSGIVNMVIGYAPLKPAEFVILYLQQSAGGVGSNKKCLIFLQILTDTIRTRISDSRCSLRMIPKTQLLASTR